MKADPKGAEKDIWENRSFLLIFFCEKENEPKEIARRDVALTGLPSRFSDRAAAVDVTYASNRHSS